MGADSIFHPCTNDNGQQVEIKKPSKATPLNHFEDQSKIASILPGGKVPEALNGVPFFSWTGRPTTPNDWLQVIGQGDFPESSMKPIPGKKLSAGVVTVEPDGRIWVVCPTNQFGGYTVTFPKGTVDKGLTPRVSAIKEAFEESGLQVELAALIGDFERTTSVTRYYLAKRVGGNPADCGWESQSQSVGLIPKARLLEVVSHPADKPLIEKVLAMLANQEV